MSGETRFSTEGSRRNPGAHAFTYARSTWLDAAVGDVFAFHENPHNLVKISPRSLAVARIEAADHARVGERFRIVARAVGWPIDWEGEWLVVESPDVAAGQARLVDGTVRAPFARFDHEHRFEVSGKGTRMTDRVTHAMLGAGWGPVGMIVNAFVGWLVLPAMFRARHAATRRWFAEARD